MGDRLVKAVLDFDSAAELDRTMPFGRVVRPADVGDLVVFLTSDSAQLMTGQRIELDGGSNTSPTTMAGRS